MVIEKGVSGHEVQAVAPEVEVVEVVEVVVVEVVVVEVVVVEVVEVVEFGRQPTSGQMTLFSSADGNANVEEGHCGDMLLGCAAWGCVIG